MRIRAFFRRLLIALLLLCLLAAAGFAGARLLAHRREAAAQAALEAMQTQDIPRSSLRWEELPPYAGAPAVALGTASDLEPRDYPALSFVRLSELDGLGRPGPALAVIGRDLMPQTEREELGQVRPAGWHTVRYDDLIEDHFLYNRCHLVGFQLCGINADERDLITGTRYLNIEGMLPYENEVASFVRRGGGHVLYRVTPIYQDGELLARGIQMEALSLEDGGKSLSFNVFVYNVQPGIEIDYRDGASRPADAP